MGELCVKELAARPGAKCLGRTTLRKGLPDLMRLLLLSPVAEGPPSTRVAYCAARYLPSLRLLTLMWLACIRTMKCYLQDLFTHTFRHVLEKSRNDSSMRIICNDDAQQVQLQRLECLELLRRRRRRASPRILPREPIQAICNQSPPLSVSVARSNNASRPPPIPTSVTSFPRFSP